jgi:hypothetical protein
LAGGLPHRGDLPLESIAAEQDTDLGTENLHRDRPAVLEVAGEVDRGHAPLADHPL